MRLIRVRSVVQLYPGPFIRNLSPAVTSMITGCVVPACPDSIVSIPVTEGPSDQTLQAIAKPLEVLLNPVLDYL